MKKFIIFACSLLLLAGCSKNEIIIYGSSPENNESDNSQPSEKEDALITFSASLESRKVTRSMPLKLQTGISMTLLPKVCIQPLPQVY